MNDDRGKTFYYLLDENNLLHICSDGMSICGLDTTTFFQIPDAKLSNYAVCSQCTPTDVTVASTKKTKKATFKTKADIVEPATGEII